MTGLIKDRHYPKRNKVLRFLYNTDFDYILEYDQNRAIDGVDLRCTWFDDNFSELIPEEFWNKPCSVLEMMVALAQRCEDGIMYDDELGDRTHVWFWQMMTSLGLSYMDDEHFNEWEATCKVNLFLHRKYEPNGKGGLFTIYNCLYDLRNIEIWYQAGWYFTNLLDLNRSSLNRKEEI